MSALPLIVASSRRRAGDAALLMVSTAVSVMAVGVFTAAAASDGARTVAASKESLAILFSSASMVTALFAALSGWFFAEHYLSKRKREIATWLLVGMKKRSAFAVLAAEFGAAGFLSFLAGSGAGALLSRFFGLALAALMRERTPIPMPFDGASFLAGGLACLLQFGVATVKILLIVSRLSIADLMRSEREAERPPRARPLLAGLGAALVLAGYSGAVFTRGAVAVLLMIPVLVATVAGTFLCFGALVPTLASSFRARWPRGGSSGSPSTLIASAQIGFRSRRNARLLALSAVLVAVAATASGTVIALNVSDSMTSRRTCPHDVELAEATPARIAAVDRALAEAGAGGRRSLALEYLPGEITFPSGDVFYTSVFSESSWTAALGLLGEQGPALGSGRIRSAMSLYSLSSSGGDQPVTLRVGGRTKGFVMAAGDFAPPVSLISANNSLVVPDGEYAAYAEAQGAGAARRVAAWDGVPPEAARAAMPALAAMEPRPPRVRIAVLAAQLGMNGALLFIGIFLAAVFILCAVSLLLFRTIEDTRDDKDRYRVLWDLGASRKVVRKALAFQDLFSFGLPLAFGLAHCAAALVMMRHISGFESAGPTAIVAAAAVPIFGLAILAAIDRQLAASWETLDPVR